MSRLNVAFFMSFAHCRGKTASQKNVVCCGNQTSLSDLKAPQQPLHYGNLTTVVDLGKDYKGCSLGQHIFYSFCFWNKIEISLLKKEDTDAFVEFFIFSTQRQDQTAQSHPLDYPKNFHPSLIPISLPILSLLWMA